MNTWKRYTESKNLWDLGNDWICSVKKMPSNVTSQVGTVACICSPSHLGDWGRRIAWAQEFKASLGNIVRLHLKKKKKIITYLFLSRPMQYCVILHTICRDWKQEEAQVGRGLWRRVNLGLWDWFKSAVLNWDNWVEMGVNYLILYMDLKISSTGCVKTEYE